MSTSAMFLDRYYNLLFDRFVQHHLKKHFCIFSSSL